MLILSLLFYFYGEPKHTILLVFSCVFNYFLALFLESNNERPKKRRTAFIIGLLVNVLMLGFFKYSDFVVKNVNAFLGTNIPLPNIALPIGISFFTFQTVSYIIDVYRKDLIPQKNIVSFSAYVTMFPQLVAGPIVRYQEIEPELALRKLGFESFSQGVWRFVIGLSKKLLLANLIGELSEKLLNGSSPSVLGLWMGAFAYMLQVYFDFSAYSDMAIGLGKMLGFHFPENFNYPFIARSLSEFWRRWHMTLGRWFRDYVYIPLGGNRVKPLRHALNLLVVWSLTGLWHGAAWNFVLWGVYFALLLLLEKRVFSRYLLKLPAFLQHVYTLFCLTISFVIFHADAGMGIPDMLKGMFFLNSLPLLTPSTLYFFKSYGVVFLMCIIASTPLMASWAKKLAAKYVRTANALQVGLMLFMLLLSTGYLVGGSFNPFLYFRF